MFCSRHLSTIPRSCPTPKGKTARRYLQTHILHAQGPKSGSKNLQDGVVDYINVEDWGNRDNGDFDVGELKTKGRVRRVLDNAQELPFMQVIANVLADAERSKQITPPFAIDRDVPPFEKWAFREDHYEQYLVDLLCVNQSMGEAVKAARREIARVQGNNNLYLDSILLDPIKMGIYRGDCIAKDIQQLRATKTEGSPEDILMPTRFASYYADILGTFCDYYTQESSSADSKNSLVAVLPRLCAHVYMISVSQIAMGNRIGSVCVEKIGLITRKAASTYLDYSTEKPPLATLVDAVNAIGENLSEDMKEEFFDELIIAASICSLLVDSLARES